MNQALLSASHVPWSSSCNHNFSLWGGNIPHPVQKAIRSHRPAPAVIKGETLSSLLRVFYYFSISQKTRVWKQTTLTINFVPWGTFSWNPNIWHDLNLSLVLNFSNQFDFYFSVYELPWSPKHTCILGSLRKQLYGNQA